MPGDPDVGAACGWIPDGLRLSSATTSVQAHRPPMDSSVRRLAHLAGPPLQWDCIPARLHLFLQALLCRGGTLGPGPPCLSPDTHYLHRACLPSTAWPLHSHPESTAEDVCVVRALGQASYLALRAGPQPSQEHHSRARWGWLAMSLYLTCDSTAFVRQALGPPLRLHLATAWTLPQVSRAHCRPPLTLPMCSLP